MLELHPRLYVGDQSDCLSGFHRFAVVHAYKPRHNFVYASAELSRLTEMV
jgi:hypothetical protein